MSKRRLLAHGIQSGQEMRTSLKILAVALVISFGLLLRLACFLDWRENSSRYLFQNDPILTTFDAYYYLRYARDLVDGKYQRIDELRVVPRNPPRPFPPPLLSAMTAVITKISKASVDWVAALLPAYLGILLFFPLYFLTRPWGSFFSSMVAGLVGLCSPYYVRRSSAGWYDTDCGVVTLTMTAVLLPFCVARSSGRGRMLWLACAFVHFLVFFMWWDQAPEVTTSICLIPLVSSYLFLIGPRKKDLPLLAAFVLGGFLFMTLWKEISFWERFLHVIQGLFLYISKAEAPHFPNIGLTISEQVRVSFEGLMALSAGNWFIFACGVTGLGLFLLKNPPYGIQLIVPIGLGILTFYAKRFAVFLTPVIALGAGHFFNVLWSLAYGGSRKWVWRVVFCLACACFVHGVWSVTVMFLGARYQPVEPPRVVEGLSLAGEDTPPDSVIWAWWDHGYPVMYWSRRGTISDGAYHGGELSVVGAFPLVTPSYRQAANWMHFHVARGLEGFQTVYDRIGSVPEGMALIKEIMAAGPEECKELLRKAKLEPEEKWLPFFFPPKEMRRPVYLLVDERLVGTSYWWYWLGSWDPAAGDGRHPFFRSFSQVKQEGKNLSGMPPFTLDMEEGMFAAGNASSVISRVVYFDGNQWLSMNYSSDGLVFQVDHSTGWGVLCSPDVFESVFNKLFFLRMADVRYFKPTRLKTSSFQLWEVIGDSGTAVK